MKSFVLILAIIFMCPIKGFSNESFYKDKARGWHWYEKKAKDDLNKQANHSEMTPTEQVKSIRKDAEEKLHKAMIEPTQENVKTFIKAQKAIGDSSEKFSQVWMQVIYNNPELDPSIKNPTSEQALKIARAEISQKKREQVKALSQEYGLLYFFKGNDQMCREFSSVVKGLSKKYEWDVMAIKIDDAGDPLFPDALPDNGIVEKFKITHVPTLLAVHPKTGKIIPLAYQYIGETEITERINTLIQEVR